MCFVEAFQSCRVTFLELGSPCTCHCRIINVWEERKCDNLSVAFRVVCLHVESFALLVQGIPHIATWSNGIPAIFIPSVLLP